MFSVVIPYYNKLDVINRSIKSVLLQSFQQFEIIIVDDGSKDRLNTNDLYCQDDRIRIIRQDNQGVSVARNVGIAHAKYDWICFLDADDEWLPTHLETIYDMTHRFSKKKVFATAHCIRLLNGSEEISNDSYPSLNGVVCIDDLFALLSQGASTPLIHTNSICIYKSLFEKYGNFVPGVKTGEDTDMWYRIAAYEDIVYTSNATTVYHREDSTATKVASYNFSWPFEKRCLDYMEDERIPASKRDSLRNFYNLFMIHKGRQFILIGNRKEARQALKATRGTIMQKKFYYQTCLAYLVPQKIITYVVRRKNRSYYGKS